jgi:hypothetical protein
VDQIVPLLVISGCLFAVLGCFAWLASRLRRRGMARDALQVFTGAYNTMYRPTAEESHYEIQAQAERRIPFASPDDVPWRPDRTPPGAGRPSRRRRWRRRSR